MSARIERRRDRVQEWLDKRADHHQTIARQVELLDSLGHRAQAIAYSTAAVTLPTSACRSVAAWKKWAGALYSGHRNFWENVLPLMDPSPDAPLPSWAYELPTCRISRERLVSGGADPADVLGNAVDHSPTAFPPSAPGPRLVWALDGLVEARLDEITDGSPREVYDRLCQMAIAANEAVLTIWRLADARWGLARGWPR